MPHFDYPCPDCRATTSLHDADCQFEGTPWVDVERAYVDIVSVLTGGPCDEETLRREVPGEWDPLRQSALSRLKRDERLSEAKSGVLRLLTAEEFREEVSEPAHEPMRTLFQYGSVPGCHDNAVFAMIAWYEMVGLSWPETRENVVNWLRETGTWDRGGFEEATPQELVEKKRHVYDAGYGWKEKATSAKRVIDRYRS